MSANTPNYLDQGGAVLVIGGELRIAATGQITAEGVQANAIADVPTAGSATAAANATAVNSILAALRGAGIIASS